MPRERENRKRREWDLPSRAWYLTADTYCSQWWCAAEWLPSFRWLLTSGLTPTFVVHDGGVQHIGCRLSDGPWHCLCDYCIARRSLMTSFCCWQRQHRRKSMCERCGCRWWRTLPASGIPSSGCSVSGDSYQTSFPSSCRHRPALSLGLLAAFSCRLTARTCVCVLHHVTLRCVNTVSLTKGF